MGGARRGGGVMSVETAIALWADRHLPPALFAEQAKAVEASGVIDGILLADQLTNFIPAQLWTPEHTPMASVIGDPDSHPDVFVMAAYLLAAAPSLSLSISTDSVRRPPAELVQTMLTLASIAEGRASFHVGGGEVKQCQPYGHKRSQGMSRMEDLFRIFHALLDAQGAPIDFDGRRWTFEKASIGGGMPHRPKLYGLGAGPQLLEHTATYCDGLAITCPPAWPDADAFAAHRAELLELVERKGRDPEAFRFAIWFPVMLAADHEQLDRNLDNPLVKWMSAIFGHIDATLWAADGLESPVPEDWNYFMHFLPHDTPQAFIDDALAKTTRAHVLKCWLSGTPGEVAEMIQPYIDAGADWVCPMDYMPLVLPPEEAQEAFGRSVELCGHIKAAQASAVAH
jgi:phthiodiolone/phenolphthiodiolone dimycocerosates ketoreductase